MIYEAFISYRRADTEVASRIYQVLKEHGRRVFFDTDALDVGDFEKSIREAIENCDMVVSVLTYKSLQRMYDNPDTDMVRRELEFCRGADQLVQFFMLLDDPAAQKGRLYETLEQYKNDEIFGWIARQNIIEFQREEDAVSGVLGISGVCDKVLQALENKSRALHFEVGGVQYVYYGQTRFQYADGKYYPWGKGQLVEKGKAVNFLVFDGEWEGSSVSHDDSRWLAGTGEVYLQGPDRQRRLIYQGHWSNLQYDDPDGILYEEDGVTVRYRGPFVKGKRVGRWETQYEEEGRIVLFKGRYNSYYEPLFGELRILHNGLEDVYHGSVRLRNDVAVPCYFGRMEYNNGTVYEGEFDSRGFWSGMGVLEIPASGFLLRMEGCFEDGAPSKGSLAAGIFWRVSVRLDGEREYRQLVFAPDGKKETVLPFYRSGYAEFHYLDGVVYKGMWEKNGGWSVKTGTKKPDGVFYDANGEEFTPSRAQLDFYHNQGKALFEPFRKWSADRTAEELRSGSPLQLQPPEQSAAEPENGEPDFMKEQAETKKTLESQAGAKKVSLSQLFEAAAGNQPQGGNVGSEN